jgi:hypothetical protein
VFQACRGCGSYSFLWSDLGRDSFCIDCGAGVKEGLVPRTTTPLQRDRLKRLHLRLVRALAAILLTGLLLLVLILVAWLPGQVSLLAMAVLVLAGASIQIGIRYFVLCPACHGRSWLGQGPVSIRWIPAFCQYCGAQLGTF